MSYFLPVDDAITGTAHQTYDYLDVLIPVKYRGEKIGEAQFDGARYVYGLAGEMEQKKNSGEIYAVLERSRSDSDPKIKISAVILFDTVQSSNS